MKPDATLKPDLTLEHVLAAAVARRVTDGTVAAPTCRVMAYESALQDFRIGPVANFFRPMGEPRENAARDNFRL